MKQLIKIVLLTFLIFNITTAMTKTKKCKEKCCDTCCLAYNDCDPCCCISSLYGHPFLAYRSQSVNASRDLVGWQQFINRDSRENYYGALALTFEYTRSIKPERIAQFFFGRDIIGCNSLLIQGSLVENRNGKAWLADYFGLPLDFESCVSFCPRIENYIADIHAYVGLDGAKRGMYFKIHAPFVRTKWQLNISESVKTEGTQSFPRGYMAEDVVERNKLAKTFIESVSGFHTFGDMQDSLEFGKMTPFKIEKTRISDVQIIFGWNPVREDDRVFGFNFRVDAPTGNRPCSFYLFEPIVGNGKHWAVGVGFNSSSILWRSETNPDNFFGVWIDANLNHLIKSCQCRSFDFCGKPNSRYMLLEEVGPNNADISYAPISDIIEQEDLDIFVFDLDQQIFATNQYQKKLIPTINWSTFPVDVRIDIQADIAIKFSYVKNNWGWDFGYNLWARSGEKYTLKDDCCYDCEEEIKYAIKGDAFIYGYRNFTYDPNEEPPLNTPVPNNPPVPISATQSCADIHSGKNFPAHTESNPALTNPEIDNPNSIADATDTGIGDEIVLATNQEDAGLFDTIYSGEIELPIRSSFDPVLVSRKDLDMSKGPSAVTHKFFVHFNYAGKNETRDWTPFIGIGGEIELDTWCTMRRGVSQWGGWIKGGVAFN